MNFQVRSYPGHDVFLRKAKELGDVLYATFGEEGEFPPAEIVISQKKGRWRTYSCYLTQYGPVTCPAPISLAEIGTLSLEFSALTKHTKLPKYDRKITQMTETLEKQWNDQFSLYPNEFYPDGFTFTDKFSVAGGADSFYEYLIKEYVHSGYTKKHLKRMYEKSVHGVIDNLLQQDITGYQYLSELHSGHIVTKMDHLACFFPGMLIYGALHLPSQGSGLILDTARQVAKTCFQMYDTPTGLAAETTWFGNGMSRSWMGEHHYALRPEAVESWFYLYAYTKDPIYREWGWKVFTSLVKHCRTEHGYAEVSNVDSGELTDSMPSYLLAETFKYLYLLFTEEKVDLKQWVFSTEGHLLRVKKPI